MTQKQRQAKSRQMKRYWKRKKALHAVQPVTKREAAALALAREAMSSPTISQVADMTRQSEPETLRPVILTVYGNDPNTGYTTLHTLLHCESIEDAVLALLPRVYDGNVYSDIRILDTRV